MDTLRFAAGDQIFSAGDPSTGVYIIDHGEVLISVDDGAARIDVAHLGAGDLFGESGVLEKRPRSATATALCDTTLLVTDAATFVHAFGLESEGALAVIKLLCRRLRVSNLRHVAPAGPPGDPAATVLLRLAPASEALAHDFAMQPVAIAQLPFQVSNRFGGEVTPVSSAHCYAIAAKADADLSAPHFEIVKRDGRYAIRDLGSRYGTIVNGQVLSRGSLVPVAAVGLDSEIVAGRAQSPFRFHLSILA
jgi:CRP-like cAMP-binding protein